MLTVNQGGIKNHFLSLFYDLTWDWTPVSQSIGKHSTHKTNIYIYIYIYIYVCVCAHTEGKLVFLGYTFCKLQIEDSIIRYYVQMTKFQHSHMSFRCIGSINIEAFNLTQEMKRSPKLTALAANHSASEIVSFLKVDWSFKLNIRNMLEASGGGHVICWQEKERVTTFPKQVQDIINSKFIRVMVESTIIAMLHENIMCKSCIMKSR